jgi:hypothetical protein
MNDTRLLPVYILVAALASAVLLPFLLPVFRRWRRLLREAPAQAALSAVFLLAFAYMGGSLEKRQGNGPFTPESFFGNEPAGADPRPARDGNDGGAPGGRALPMVREGGTPRRPERKVAGHRFAHHAVLGRVHLAFQGDRPRNLWRWSMGEHGDRLPHSCWLAHDRPFLPHGRSRTWHLRVTPRLRVPPHAAASVG